MKCDQILAAALVSGVCVDLDGTTLNSQQRLTPRTVRALRAADEAGIEVCIATGRPASAVQPFVDEIGLSLVCICFNGAASMRLAPDRDPEILAAIPATHSEEILACAERLGLCLSCCSATRSYANPKTVDHETMLKEFERLEGVEQTRGITAEAVNEALKFVAICGEGRVEEVARATSREIGDRVRVVPAEMHVEFLNPTANKGTALTRLFSEERLRSSFAAFGDNVNDIEMLRVVGDGVAMKNAKQSVKDEADRVSTWSNDEEGVALEVERFLSLREHRPS